MWIPACAWTTQGAGRRGRRRMRAGRSVVQGRPVVRVRRRCRRSIARNVWPRAAIAISGCPAVPERRVLRRDDGHGAEHVPQAAGRRRSVRVAPGCARRAWCAWPKTRHTTCRTIADNCGACSSDDACRSRHCDQASARRRLRAAKPSRAACDRQALRRYAIDRLGGRSAPCDTVRKSRGTGAAKSHGTARHRVRKKFGNCRSKILPACSRDHRFGTRPH